MRPRTKTIMLTALLPWMVLTGCTDSDPIATGNSELTVQIELVNAETPFDNLAEFSIIQINVRPNDPASDAALGQAPVGLIATASDVLDINLNQPLVLTPTTLVLSSGSWRISNLTVGNVLLLKDDQTPQPACEDFFFFSSPSTIVYTAADFMGDANFNISADGQGTLNIQIDGSAFVEAFTNSWDCAGVIPLTFRRTDFVARAPEYFDITAQ